MAINFVRIFDGSDDSIRFQPMERLKVYLFGATVLFASFGMGEAVYRLLFSEFDGATDRIPVEVLFGLVFALLTTKFGGGVYGNRKERSARLNFIWARVRYSSRRGQRSSIIYSPGECNNRSMIADRTADLSEKHAHGLGGATAKAKSSSTGFLRPLAISRSRHPHPETSQGGVREAEVAASELIARSRNKCFPNGVGR